MGATPSGRLARILPVTPCPPAKRRRFQGMTPQFEHDDSNSGVSFRTTECAEYHSTPEALPGTWACGPPDHFQSQISTSSSLVQYKSEPVTARYRTFVVNHSVPSDGPDSSSSVRQMRVLTASPISSYLCGTQDSPPSGADGRSPGAQNVGPCRRSVPARSRSALQRATSPSIRQCCTMTYKSIKCSAYLERWSNCQGQLPPER